MQLESWKRIVVQTSCWSLPLLSLWVATMGIRYLLSLVWILMGKDERKLQFPHSSISSCDCNTRLNWINIYLAKGSIFLCSVSFIFLYVSSWFQSSEASVPRPSSKSSLYMSQNHWEGCKRPGCRACSTDSRSVTKIEPETKWNRSNDESVSDDICDYFGIKIAFYFSWLGHYTTALCIPAAVGFLVWVKKWLQFPPTITYILNQKESNCASILNTYRI